MGWLKKRLPKKRWKRVCLYILSGFAVLVAADMALVQYWRHVTISPETTHITSPLLPDGLPDYVAARNAAASQGVTADNNAAPALLQITGTDQFPWHWQEYVRPQLGLSSAQPKAVVTYWDWLQKRQPLFFNENEDEGAGSYTPAQETRVKETDDISRVPWKSSEHPDRMMWLHAQQGVLIQLNTALEQDRFYVPWYSMSPGEITSSLLPWISGIRACSNFLAADAMRAAGDGDGSAFRRDALDIAKLARLAAQGSTLIEYLTAVAIEDEASLAVQHGVTAKFLGADDARRLLRSWLALPPFPDESHVLDIGERFSSLNNFCEGSRLGLRAAMGGQGTPNLMQQLFAPIHYNGILRTFNHYFDEIVAAYQLPTYKQRAAAVKAVERESMVDRNWLSIGDLLVAVVMPSLGRSVVFEERGIIDHDLATVALALRVYREEHGAFPVSLAELSPGVLPELPTDGFADAPFRYRREGRGYVLYSVGDDGKDDGGRTKAEWVQGGGWDTVVRAAD